MKLSPLQLESYFVTDMNCRANPEYTADKEPTFGENDLTVTANVSPIPERPLRWQVSLNIKLQPKPEANSPYSFCFNMVGIIWVATDLPQEKLESLVQTNGPSMLYGAGREVARHLMATGPFAPLILPSVSFIADTPTKAVAKPLEAPNMEEQSKTENTAGKT